MTNSDRDSLWRQSACSPSEAVADIKPGERIFLGSACATPRVLISALENREDCPRGVQLLHFLTDGAIPKLGNDYWTRFTHRVFFVGSDVREFVKAGRAEYVPISVSQLHRLIETDRLPINVALIQVAPPDEQGQCSLGVSVDVTLAAIEHADRVIAEINPNMPRTHGGASVALEDIHQWTVVDDPVIEYLHPPADEVAEQIARYVARIIDDGSTLQIGLGQIPNEMLKYLTNRRDLGIHSDVLTEPIFDLVEKGVITGSHKTLHKGKIIGSLAMGSRRLYDLLDDNPAFELHPLSYVCDPTTIAANHKMVSVTQALAIDLSGQVCADQFAGELYSGVSTQPEFVRGAAASEGGKAIICLASTTEDGGVSRIRARLLEGEGVVVPRADVHYVITEYGVAYLFGHTLRERAEALIEIAHPRFRDQLLAEAKKLNLVDSSCTIKSRSRYPVEEEREVELKNGATVMMRPTKTSDVEMMKELFYSLRPEDIVTRFFTNLTSLTNAQARHLCSVSYDDEMAFVVVKGDIEHETVIASGCYYRNATTNLADVAYLVHPEWHGLGLATTLQNRLIEYARRSGIRGFTADILVDNTPMLKVFEKSDCRMEKKISRGVHEVVLYF